jgi:hypothetical protein
MILLPANFNTTLSQLDLEEATTVFDEALTIIHNLVEFAEVLVDADEYLKQNPGTDYSEAQLDAVEAVLLDLRYNSLEMFDESLYASFDSTQRRITNSVHYLKQLNEILTSLSNAYVYLTTEDVKLLKELVDNILAELCYFVFFQFELDATQRSLASGKETQVSVVVHRYSDLNRYSVDSLLAYIQALMKQYRPVLGLFEIYPQLEEEFYNIAGAYIKDFDMLSEYLTLDVVSAVINGTSDVEKVIASIEHQLSQGEI